MAGETEAKVVLEAGQNILKLLMEMARQHQLGNESKQREAELKLRQEEISLRKGSFITAKNPPPPGEVRYDRLKDYADSTKASISMQSGIAQKDIDDIMNRARLYGIPIAVVPDDKDNKTLAYLSRDGDIVKQVMTDIVKERMQANPKEYSAVPIDKDEVNLFVKEFENRGINASVIMNADGDYYCLFNRNDRETVKSVYEHSNSLTPKERRELYDDTVKIERVTEIRLKDEPDCLKKYHYHRVEISPTKDREDLDCFYCVIDDKGHAIIIDENTDKNALNAYGMNDEAAETLLQKHEQIQHDNDIERYFNPEPTVEHEYNDYEIDYEPQFEPQFEPELDEDL
jgi:hypothetical protein